MGSQCKEARTCEGSCIELNSSCSHYSTSNNLVIAYQMEKKRRVKKIKILHSTDSLHIKGKFN